MHIYKRTVKPVLKIKITELKVLFWQAEAARFDTALRVKAAAQWMETKWKDIYPFLYLVPHLGVHNSWSNKHCAPYLRSLKAIGLMQPLAQETERKRKSSQNFELLYTCIKTVVIAWKSSLLMSRASTLKKNAMPWKIQCYQRKLWFDMIWDVISCSSFESRCTN